MKTALNTVITVLAAVLLSGCAGAAFNRLNLTVSRNITVGQELLDLKTAHEEGVISDTEYMKAKKDILHLVDQLGEIKTK